MAGEWRRQLLRAARAQWTAAAGNTAGPTSRRLLGDAAGTVAAAAGAAGRAAADPAPTTTNVQRSMLWALFARQGVLRRPPPLSRALSDSGYVDRRGVEHFKRRGVEAWLPSSAAQAQSGGGGGASSGRTRTAAAVLVVVAGGVAYVVATHMEVVPYTKRRHVVLISPETERRLGESEFQKIKSQFKDNILPDLHPVTIKVRRVATKIIQAAYAGVDADDWGKVHDHDPRHISADDIFGQRAEDKHRGAAWGLFGDHAATAAEEHRRGLAPSAAALSGGGGDKEAEAGADEHLEEDTWIERSRAARGGERPATRHLEGLKWEVVVVDKNVMNAFCLPGGKICVFTGLLKLFPHEAEIATVLGHEVGHVVARHVAERLTTSLWVTVVKLLLVQATGMPFLASDIGDLLLTLPFSRKMEMEADRIGVLLMAAAGYDPRVAPGLYLRMDAASRTPEFVSYLSTHPSGRRRAAALAQSATMREALRIYEQVAERRRLGQGGQLQQFFGFL